MEMFRVLDPGPYTTVQDSGRYGFQQYGIPVSGALDAFAYQVANLLVDNPPNAACLESTFVGPRLEALGEGLVAVTGADLPVFVNDRPQSTWESFSVSPGDVISFKAARRGVRAYISVGRGIWVPEVMGSRSTYTGAGIGGLNGRPLIRGDVLERGPNTNAGQPKSLPPEFRPEFPAEIVLRALPGPQDDYFDAGMKTFFSANYVVSSKADRMGYCLEGPLVLFKEGAPESIISEPSLSGAVQIPPDGRPIILLVEQTVGGYAKIATVISPDLDLVAQARPGDRVRFSVVDLEQAHKAFRNYVTRVKEVRRILAG